MDCLLAAATCAGLVAAFYIPRSERRFAATVLRDVRRASTDAEIFIDRHSTQTIHRRGKIFTAYVCCSTGIAEIYLRCYHSQSLLGPSLHDWPTTAFCATSTALLMLGPLTEHLLRGQMDLAATNPTPTPVDVIARNYFLAPLGEELLFRGLIFHVLSHRSPWVQIILSTLLFSAAHSHHVFYLVASSYRARLSSTPCGAKLPSEGDAWADALQRLGAQWIATACLGLLSGIYFHRVCRNNVLALATTHALCNAVGPPSLECFHEDSGFSRHQSAFIGLAYGCGVVSWAGMMSYAIEWNG